MFNKKLKEEIRELKNECMRLKKTIQNICTHKKGFDYEVNCFWFLPEKSCKICKESIPIDFNTYIKEKYQIELSLLKEDKEKYQRFFDRIYEKEFGSSQSRVLEYEKLKEELKERVKSKMKKEYGWGSDIF